MNENVNENIPSIKVLKDLEARYSKIEEMFAAICLNTSKLNSDFSHILNYLGCKSDLVTNVRDTARSKQADTRREKMHEQASVDLDAEKVGESLSFKSELSETVVCVGFATNSEVPMEPNSWHSTGQNLPRRDFSLDEIDASFVGSPPSINSKRCDTALCVESEPNSPVISRDQIPDICRESTSRTDQVLENGSRKPITASSAHRHRRPLSESPSRAQPPRPTRPAATRTS